MNLCPSFFILIISRVGNIKKKISNSLRSWLDVRRRQILSEEGGGGGGGVARMNRKAATGMWKRRAIFSRLTPLMTALPP